MIKLNKPQIENPFKRSEETKNETWFQFLFNPHVHVVTTKFSETAGTKADGAKEVETLRQFFNKKQLFFAWCSLLLVSTTVALEKGTTSTYSAVATSHFNELGLLSAVGVVRSVLYAVTRPTISKLADVLGRVEALIIAVVFYIIGFAMLAGASNISTYFAAHIFYVSGEVGIQFMEQVFATDTSNLKNRAFFLSLPNFAFLYASWISAPVASAILKHSTYRWGYGMWCIIMPVVSIPVLFILMRLKLKARAMGLEYGKAVRNFKTTFRQFDVVGLILFTAGLCLLFLAVTLATGPKSWGQAHTLVMIILGPILLVIFPFWEKFVPRYPFMPSYVLTNRTMFTTCLIIFGYALAYFLYGTYYLPWLMVCKNLSVKAATNVVNVFVVGSSISSFIAAFYAKYFNRMKPVVIAGGAIYMLGIGLTYNYRKPQHRLSQFIVSQCVEAVGAGFLQTPMISMIHAVVPHHNVITATAIYQSIMTVGSIVAEAIAGTLYRQSYPKELAKHAPFLTPQQAHSVVNNLMAPVKLYPWGTPEREAIVTAFNIIYRRLLYPPIIIAGVITVIACTLPDPYLGDIYEPEQTDSEAENSSSFDEKIRPHDEEAQSPHDIHSSVSPEEVPEIEGALEEKKI
ncbi:Siderophore iron transporter mirC [Yarrowia sp. B02]|nr:Siderophore iron transporter mirC [Yarrowia sp. B02]